MPKKLGNVVLYSVRELSGALGVSELTIRSYLRTGKLKGRKLGVQWYVIEESLHDYFVIPAESIIRDKSKDPKRKIKEIKKPLAKPSSPKNGTSHDKVNKILLEESKKGNNSNLPPESAKLKNLFTKQWLAAESKD
ncbi:MAG: hypothetical protein DKM50_13205 [Candidatus Margulisiibacteriota bacterium]|nr:MAG: hypothetical protein A2X43_13890 [Candidatus Margulisbacteria bacterium GWD2_39_127]OGI05531.1 MAG: hypothetical protein A2X42_00560 [Candidatus Margulisbacteria bacterium GWF2_38_17]OGI08388.1 MAG: hypothetical protein A2X41_10780 [Candidatus Margulisbacteria bacterium GWE2_39_32]PZM77359.1 MAG: hypothetical protein DKM50_13205 [Candidatus Margulisiibacteriota bacterium]HAR63131.1 hypothetical protein [Candidatus Margulisiibacteriota bacterium]